MATIDIREGEGVKVDKIQFEAYAWMTCDGEVISIIDDEDDGELLISVTGIDNLIKALTKAKELWA